MLSGTSRGVAINALHLHEAFCVTGSEDGLLRVWPLDFSAVFMEAGKADYMYARWFVLCKFFVIYIMYIHV